MDPAGGSSHFPSTFVDTTGKGALLFGGTEFPVDAMEDYALFVTYFGRYTGTD